MSHALYQLKTPPDAEVGRLVRIDGPYDTWGRVIKLQESGFHLIRGLGRGQPKIKGTKP